MKRSVVWKLLEKLFMYRNIHIFVHLAKGMHLCMVLDIQSVVMVGFADFTVHNTNY